MMLLFVTDIDFVIWKTKRMKREERGGKKSEKRKETFALRNGCSDGIADTCNAGECCLGGGDPAGDRRGTDVRGGDRYQWRLRCEQWSALGV